MAVPTVVRATSGRLASGPVLTYAIDGSGGDCLVAGAHLFENIVISGVTYNAVSLTQVRRDHNIVNDTVSEIWYLPSPASGTNDVVVTAASSTNELVSGATLLAGTDATPLDAHNGAVREGSPTSTITVALNTTVDDCIVVDAISSGAATTATVGANQAEQYNDDGAGVDPLVGGSTEDAPTAASHTMSWGLGANRRWCTSAAAFKGASGTPPVTLTVADTSHAHTAESPALTQANTLSVDSAVHGHTAESPALVQQNVLAVDDASHAHAAESPVLEVGGTLNVDGVLHAHSADNVALTQAHTLAVADALHGHTADSPTLSLAFLLAVADALHSHTAESPTLSTVIQLIVADALHGHAAESPSLTQQNVLAVMDALHAHTAGNVVLVDDAIPPSFTATPGTRSLTGTPGARSLVGTPRR